LTAWAYRVGRDADSEKLVVLLGLIGYEMTGLAELAKKPEDRYNIILHLKEKGFPRDRSIRSW